MIQKLALAAHKLAIFFWRDLVTARSYRAVFVLEALQALFGVTGFYFVSQFVESPQLSRALPQGGNYFAFAVVGFAFFDYLAVALNAFDDSIEQARQNGTLEVLLVTETSLPMILAGSVLYPFVVMSLRVAVYLGWAIMLFHFPTHNANWAGALSVLLAAIAAFCGLGVFASSYLLLFKRGNPAKWLLLGISGVVSGMLYPLSVLPRPLQMIAHLIPVTYALDGMRAALLGHASLAELWPAIGMLLLFAIILLPLSLLSFSWALRRTKVTGTLTHF
jgi:ABC-2 type transport system permease protein